MNHVRSKEEVADLYRRHGSMVYQICLMLLKNVPDAEDATQTVFRKVMEQDKPFRDPEHEKAWIIRVTINECKDVLKSGWRRRSVPLDELIEREVPFLPSEDTGVLAAVQRLPVRYREAVYLYYYEGYNAEEIAAMVGAKPAAVRQRLARAREKLRKELEGSGYETI